MSDERPKPRTKWAIRVTMRNGGDAYLRHGSVPGRGRIATFNSRKDAEINAESMVAPGLDAGDVVTVVRVTEDMR